MTRLPLALLPLAAAFALAACGGDDRAPATSAPATTPASTAGGTPAASTPAATAPANAPAGIDAPAGNGKPAASVSGCATEIGSNDMMQFDVGSITVPGDCSQFTITLRHDGKLPAQSMGHNVVIARAADVAAVAEEGMRAGPEADYVKADDPRVVAHTDVIGGGETTSVTFDVAPLREAGPWQFFCSFPGHWAVMKGDIAVQ